VDTWQGLWTAAASQGGGNFSGRAPPLQGGFHILYAYATDGQEASLGTGATLQATSPLVGAIAAYGFLAPQQTATLAPSTLSFGGQPVGARSGAMSATLSNPGSSLTIAGVAISGANSADFAETDNCDGSLAAGGNCQIQATFTPSQAGPESATLTVTDDAGGVNGSTQTVALSGTGQDFALSATNSTLTVTAGGTATDSLQLSSLGALNGTAALTCSGEPAKSTCTVTPSSVTVGGNPASASLSIVTTAASVTPSGPSAPGAPSATLWLGLLALLGSLAAAVLRRLAPAKAGGLVPLGFALALATAICVSCAGGGGAGGGGLSGTPPGTYTITVSATSGSLSHTVNVSLTVQ